MKDVKVSLVTCTAHPIEAIYIAWQQSRTEDAMPSAEELTKDCRLFPSTAKEVEALAAGVLASQTPVVEIIHFLFLLEHVSISLREQLVRHRVGHRFGPELGVDQVPGPIDSTFWTQSMRVMDMGCFADTQAYQTPESILKHSQQHSISHSLRQVLEDHMKKTQGVYRRLLDEGIPPEDARCVIPLAATHRMIWSTNLAALRHVLKNRSCWLAQLGLWKPVVHQIVEILRGLSPLFGQLALPPCIKLQDGKKCWQGCPFPVDNLARDERKDPGTPCALWLQQRFTDRTKHEARLEASSEYPYQVQYSLDKQEHEELWGFTVQELDQELTKDSKRIT